MVVTTATRNQEHFAVRVLQRYANYAHSKAAGTMLTLEELPQLLRTSLAALENTRHFQQKGYVLFYLLTVGTEMDGPHKFNPEGTTFYEMFKPVTIEEFSKLPFNEKAYFYGGTRPLYVMIGSTKNGGEGRINVSAEGNYELDAPIVVVKKGRTGPVRRGLSALRELVDLAKDQRRE
jgi:UDP:flavonoid glycosyltransferase YjiC (YdhE family)